MPDLSKTILITTSDVAAGHEEAFDAWYEDVHLPEILACPGFIRARRYECADGEPRFLAVYDLESPEALDTPEMRAVYGWGPMAKVLRNSHARVYTLTYDTADPEVAR